MDKPIESTGYKPDAMQRSIDGLRHCIEVSNKKMAAAKVMLAELEAMNNQQAGRGREGMMSNRDNMYMADINRLEDERDYLRDEIERLRSELSDGIATAFNMNPLRQSGDKPCETLDEQLRVLNTNIKQAVRPGGNDGMHVT